MRIKKLWRGLRGAASFFNPGKRTRAAVLTALFLFGAAGTFGASQTVPETEQEEQTDGASDISFPNPSEGQDTQEQTERPAEKPVSSHKKRGMVKEEGGTYYYLKSGKKARSRWIRYQSRSYYFGSDGKLVRNRYVGRYFVNSRGERVEGLNRKKLRGEATRRELRRRKRLIIVGASRVVHMSEDVKNTAHAVYIAKRGGGLNFLCRRADGQINAYLSMFPNRRSYSSWAITEWRNISDICPDM